MESVVLPETVPEEERVIDIVTVIETDPDIVSDEVCVVNRLCDTLLLSDTESEGVWVTDWLEDTVAYPELDCDGESEKEGSDDRLETNDTESIAVTLAE